LLLWRWSTTVQITSELIIAIFFVLLARSLGRAELRGWASAWVVNLTALSVVFVFWALQPGTRASFAVLAALYVFLKTLFVVLLGFGTASFSARSARIPFVQIVVGVAAFSMLAGAFAQTIDRLGVIESMAIFLGLAAGTAYVLRARPPGYAWLATGFVVRALLAVAESAAHGEQVVRAGEPAQTVAIFLASYSSFDAGAEWMIALGCVLVLYRTILRELRGANMELLAAKEEMQSMLDHDQLTGVLSRRALARRLREAQETGAAVLFFDLD